MSEQTPESGHNHTHSNGYSLSKSLTGKLGPFPGFVWVALAVLGYIVYRWWKTKHGTVSAAATANSNGPSTSAETYPNGASDTGYLSDFGPGSYTVTPPLGGTSGTVTNPAPVVDHSHDLQYVVDDIADMEILLANGVPTSSIAYSGFDPNANKAQIDPTYGVPAGLSRPSSDNLVYVGLAGSGAPQGATVLQGATRKETLAMVQDFIRQHPTVKLAQGTA